MKKRKSKGKLKKVAKNVGKTLKSIGDAGEDILKKIDKADKEMNKKIEKITNSVKF